MINWRKIPVVKLLLPFLVGVLLESLLQVNLIVLGVIILLIILSLAFVSGKSKSISDEPRIGVLYLLLMVFFGWGWTSVSKDRFQKLPQELEVPIVKINEVSKTKKGDKLKAIVAIQNGNYGKAVCYFPKDSTLKVNSILILKDKLKPIEHTKNPLAFDYANYLDSKGIFYQGFYSNKDYKRVGNEDHFSLHKWSNELREKLLVKLKENNVTESQYAIAAALLLGDKTALDDNLREAYSTAGAMHVLAVSGLHVGIVFMMLQFLMGRYKDRSKRLLWWQAIVSILFLWFFALITGLGPSVVRASTMFSFVVLGQAMNRKASIYNIIAASALFLLIIDPQMLFEVGFQLSYLAVIGIIYFQPKIASWFYVKNKYLDYVWQLTAVSIAAQISTLPITLYYFHSFPTYFFLTNLLVIPAASIVIGLGVIVLITSIVPVISGVFGSILNLVLVWLNKGVFFISLLPGSTIDGISINEVEVVLLYSLVILSAIAFYTKKGKYLVASLVTMLLFVALDVQEDYFLAQENDLIIWNINKQTIISSIGEQNEVYTSTNDAKQLNYALGNYYAAHDRDMQPIKHFDQDSLNVLNLNGKKIVVIPQKHSIKIPEEKFKTDLLLVTNNCPLSLQTLTQQFDFKTIVFDASNSDFTVKRYSDEASLLDLHYINTRESGAYILNLSDF